MFKTNNIKINYQLLTEVITMYSSSTRSPTAEDYLKCAMKKEYHSAAKSEYKTTVHHSSSGSNYPHMSHVRVAEPGMLITPSGIYLQDHVGFVIGYHGARAQTPTPTPSPRYGSYPQLESPRVQVPDYLAARGIRAAEEKPKPKTSTYIKCGVPGCHIQHLSHYCNVCGTWDVSHSDCDCPLYKCRRY